MYSDAVTHPFEMLTQRSAPAGAVSLLRGGLRMRIDICEYLQCYASTRLVRGTACHNGEILMANSNRRSRASFLTRRNRRAALVGDLDLDPDF